MQKPSLKQRIGLVLLGIFLCLATLEIGLRLAGFIILSRREHKNRMVLREKDVYRIMCIGGSTTADSGSDFAYPNQLEEILNQRNTGIRFRVINKGRDGADSTLLLSQLEENLNRYRPDMVIAMMGVNDGMNTVPYEDTFAVKMRLFFNGFRIYKLTKILWLHIVNKAREAGLCEVNEEKVDSGNAEQYTSLGRRYMQQARYEEAGEMFKKAIETYPENDSAFIDMGEIYFRQARYKEAEKMYRKAIELNPSNCDAFSGLGKSLKFQDKPEEAIEAERKAVELCPGDSNHYVLLGITLMEFGNFEAAEEALEKAIEINPKNAWAYQQLDFCYSLQEKYSEKQRLSRKIIELNPDNEILCGLVATAYRKQGKYKEADRYYQRANEFRMQHYNPATRHNYRLLKEITAQRGIKLVCVQYPMRNIQPLKKLFDSTEGIIFVDNEKIFKEALRHSRYEDYFRDNFGGDFGHCTPKGNRLLAENVANVILKEVFGM